jgi:hypothetical protein
MIIIIFIFERKTVAKLLSGRAESGDVRNPNIVSQRESDNLGLSPASYQYCSGNHSRYSRDG